MEGFRPHGDVLAAMARAAIVVVPGRWPEPFGLVALEAMASGAPLIVVPTGGLADMVGDAALNVAPDAADIATAIVALAKDPARRAVLSDAGRARAKDYEAARHGAAAGRATGRRPGDMVAAGRGAYMNAAGFCGGRRWPM